MQMIDLSPQPQDKAADTGELSAAPRHDPVEDVASKRHHSWLLTHDAAEAGIQFLSRWAGPFVLVATLGLAGWWLFR